MKAIMVMFDSLNRALLRSYGCDWTRTPSRFFDIENDPGQLTELDDPAVVKKMKALIAEYMKETDAPEELYYRYGIER